jgi:hypothetical protein
MAHDRSVGAGHDTLHAPPAAAHINEGRIFTVYATEGIPPANLPGQAPLAGLADIVIHHQHNITGCAFDHFFDSSSNCVEFGTKLPISLL